MLLLRKLADMDNIEGELGRPTAYQMRAIFAAALLIFVSTIPPQAGAFYNTVPRHRCRLPLFDNQTKVLNITEEEMMRLALPAEDSCHQYWQGSLSGCINTNDLSCFMNLTNATVVPCKMGYLYDQTYFEQTVVTEWDLVCNNQIWNSFTKSLYFAGALFGAPPTGYLVDRFGRRFSAIALCLGLLVAGIGCSFAPTFGVYCFFRFLEGATSLPIMIAVYPYVNEMSGRKYRTYVGTIMIFITASAHTLEALGAFFLRNWRHLNLCFATLTVPFLLICAFIPESPRWLLMKGKHEEARKVLDRYAKSKGKTINDDEWKSVIDIENKKMESVGDRSQIADLFRQPYTRVVTIITIFLWFSISAVFYGLVLNVGTLAGDPYLNAAINGFMEIIALVLYAMLVFKCGSLFCIRMGLFCSGTLCLIAMAAKRFSHLNLVVHQVVRWVSIAGKLFISISFAASYQYTPDVNPTVSRGTAMALVACFGRIGSIVIPYLQVNDIVFGILGISSAALCFLLPNTSRKVFLTTLDEAENYYRENMRKLPACIGKRPVQSEELNETESGRKLINNDDSIKL